MNLLKFSSINQNLNRKKNLLSLSPVYTKGNLAMFGFVNMQCMLSVKYTIE